MIQKENFLQLPRNTNVESVQAKRRDTTKETTNTTSVDCLSTGEDYQNVEQTDNGSDLEVEGIDTNDASWGDYPLDDLLIRNEQKSIFEVNQRIDKEIYMMNPEFQRDFIWNEEKQSKLIESVLMRIPLPVFYLAENTKGQMIVVDGLQRLTTFNRFLCDQLKLRLPHRNDLNGKRFSELIPKLHNRFEDCNLIFYIIDAAAPEGARLDIFERVNSGEALSRQQMRNCLYMGPATKFLKNQANTDLFLTATGHSLNKKSMRDREFVNRFCAFALIELGDYRGDMDDFLATALTKMNMMEEASLLKLEEKFHRGLANNIELFGRHAFRKHIPEQTDRRVINASLWDVMVTLLSRYSIEQVKADATSLQETMYKLLEDESFHSVISIGTNGTKQVNTRFSLAYESFGEVLDADSN